jgi:catechol 2,3-dioxygenase-like lactoylglutathione lyase family enzyme
MAAHAGGEWDLGQLRPKEAQMLGDKNVAVTLAVSDLDRAKDFYENVLGLKDAGIDMGDAGVFYKSGDAVLFLYQSAYAGTNKATAATWDAGDDFDRIVDDLRASGVTFEHYDDLPGTTRDGDIHLMGDMKAVWFKDPDGNILNIGKM